MSNNNANQNQIASILGRIRQIISDVCRAYEFSGNLNTTQLSSSKNNLHRIRSQISDLTFNNLENTINSLLSIPIKNVQDNMSFMATRLKSGGKGRPFVNITNDQLHMFYDEGYTVTAMSKHFKCSKSIIYKRLYEQGLFIRSRFSRITNEDLEDKIKVIHEQHPNSGYEMMSGYLRAQGLYIQRHKIRTTLSKVDPVGLSNRWSTSIKRRVYKVPTPNALWHMDAHLKLSRWGFVIHGCIDGYSRMILYLSCATSIQAEPVLALFSQAVVKHSFPSRVRSDHGYENIFVAVLMNLIRGLDRGSHITGKSVHNQRIERLWVDVYKEVVDKIYKELYSLENEELLDPENEIHRYCVQYIYINVINKNLSSFLNAWNLHKIRTANKKTPRQLWLDGMLQNYNSTYTAIQEVFDQNIDFPDQVRTAFEQYGINMNVINDRVATTSSFTAVIHLNEEQHESLNHILQSHITSKEKYVACSNFLLN